MPRRKKTSKRLAAAQEAHDKFLRSKGIDPSRPPTLRGAVAEPHAPPQPRTQPLPDTSDTIPGHGPARAPRGDNAGKVIGQPYHKGPLMVLGGKSDLATNKRRDR